MTTDSMSHAVRVCSICGTDDGSRGELSPITWHIGKTVSQDTATAVGNLEEMEFEITHYATTAINLCICRECHEQWAEKDAAKRLATRDRLHKLWTREYARSVEQYERRAPNRWRWLTAALLAGAVAIASLLFIHWLVAALAGISAAVCGYKWMELAPGMKNWDLPREPSMDVTRAKLGPVSVECATRDVARQMMHEANCDMLWTPSEYRELQADDKVTKSFFGGKE